MTKFRWWNISELSIFRQSEFSFTTYIYFRYFSDVYQITFFQDLHDHVNLGNVRMFLCVALRISLPTVFEASQLFMLACLKASYQREELSVCLLEPAASLFMRRSAEKVHLSSAPDLRGLMQSRRHKQEKSRHSRVSEAPHPDGVSTG